MRKRTLVYLAVFSMVVGLAQGATIRYYKSGDYFDTTNSTFVVNGWQSLTVPGSNDTARFNWGGNTVTLSNAAPNVNAFQMGVDSSGELLVESGGSLTANSNSKVGNNSSCTGTLTINAGGTVTNNGGWLMVAGNSTVTGVVELNGGSLIDSGHLWCATGAGSTALVTINSGTLSVGAMIGLGTVSPADLGNTGGTATVNVNGGVLALSNIHAGIDNDPVTGNSIRAGSVLNVAGSGLVTLPGNFTNVINAYVAAGSITGNGVTNNTMAVLNFDTPGETNTWITAILATPNVVGDTLSGASNTLVNLGYTVGTVSTGYAPGFITGEVIEQDPPAGTPHPPGSAVNLVLQELRVPDVVGDSFTDATNTIVGLGYTVGTLTTNYVYGGLSGHVLSQNPVGDASLGSGSPIDLELQEANGPEATTVWNPAANPGPDFSLIWTNALNWTLGATRGAPERETQDLKVVLNVSGAGECVLDTFAACAALVMGDNGEALDSRLRVVDGGHLVAGVDGDGNTTWTGVSYNRTATLTIETNGLVEAKANTYVGNGNGDVLLEGHLIINGGTYKGKTWLGFGNSSTVDLASGGGDITITAGGTLDIERFVFWSTNALIYMEEGSILLRNDQKNTTADRIADGTIVIAPGYSYTLENNIPTPEGNRCVLSVFLPGYANWAATFLPTVIGAETDDYDGDQRNNFYEYALNGDPTDILNVGVEPTMTDVGGSFEYTHLIRIDDPGLIYSVMTSTDLMIGFANSGFTVLGTNVTGGAYDEVVNSIPQTADETFVQLHVE